MQAQAKRRIQLILLALFVIAGIRLFMVMRERSRNAAAPVKSEALPLNPDYYVYPKKLHDYDVASLRKDLVGRMVWVKEGYRYSYYPFDPQRRHADLGKEAGTLGPIEKLEITEVVTQASPGQAGAQQILAAFKQDGKSDAVPIGVAKGGANQIYADEIFYIQDPHDLYKHWPADIWEAISRHEVKSGMNELQAAFAIGMGVPQPSDNADVKVVKYPNGGHPLTVTYRNGRAADISKS